MTEQILTQLFLRLARLNAPSRQERPVADAVIAYLDQLGLPVEEDQAGASTGGNCGNLLCRVPANWGFSQGQTADSDGAMQNEATRLIAMPPLLLSTHLDTVQPCHDKHVRLDADRIFRSDGQTILGADDLAGVTAVLAVLSDLKADSLPHRALELLFSVGEEVHLQGISKFDIKRLQSREGYVLDTSGAPGLGVIAAPGHIYLAFTVTGRPAHAGIRPESGISAITAAARGIAAMRLGRINDSTTANIGQISGGGETNIVADRCTVTAECRSLDPDQLASQAAHMQDCMENAARQLGAQVTVETHTSYHPYQVDPDEPVAQRFAAACRTIGKTAQFISTGGGSDMNVLARSGLRGMVLSCGMQQVHTREEYLALDDLIDLTRLLQAIVRQPI